MAAKRNTKPTETEAEWYSRMDREVDQEYQVLVGAQRQEPAPKPAKKEEEEKPEPDRTIDNLEGFGRALTATIAHFRAARANLAAFRAAREAADKGEAEARESIRKISGALRDNLPIFARRVPDIVERLDEEDKD